MPDGVQVKLTPHAKVPRNKPQAGYTFLAAVADENRQADLIAKAEEVTQKQFIWDGQQLLLWPDILKATKVNPFSSSAVGAVVVTWSGARKVSSQTKAKIEEFFSVKQAFDIAKASNTLTEELVKHLATLAKEALVSYYEETKEAFIEAADAVGAIALLPEKNLSIYATKVLFGGIIMPLSDSFKLDGRLVYHKFYAHLLQVVRSGFPELDNLLNEFAIPNTPKGEQYLNTRVLEHAVNDRVFSGNKEAIRKVFVLTRGNVGGEIAITSILINKAINIFSNAEVILLAGKKTIEMFGGNPRIKINPVPYEPKGTVLVDMNNWLLTYNAIRQEVESANLKDGEYLIIDNDSRVTRLGMLPLIKDRSMEKEYHFFLRTMMTTDEIANIRCLGEDTSLWVDRVFGVSSQGEKTYPTMYLRNPDTDYAKNIFEITGLKDEFVVAINVGVSGAHEKRISDKFEQDLIIKLLESGSKVMLDKGFGEEEETRTSRIVEVVKASGFNTAEFEEAKEINNNSITKPDLITFKGGMGKFAALVGESSMYIGYDSQGQHVAAALNRPLIAIFAGYPVSYFPARWKPYSIPQVAIEILETEDRRADEAGILKETLEKYNKIREKITSSPVEKNTTPASKDEKSNTTYNNGYSVDHVTYDDKLLLTDLANSLAMQGLSEEKPVNQDVIAYLRERSPPQSTYDKLIFFLERGQIVFVADDLDGKTYFPRANDHKNHDIRYFEIIKKNKEGLPTYYIHITKAYYETYLEANIEAQARLILHFYAERILAPPYQVTRHQFACEKEIALVHPSKRGLYLNAKQQTRIDRAVETNNYKYLFGQLQNYDIRKDPDRIYLQAIYSALSQIEEKIGNFEIQTGEDLLSWHRYMLESDLRTRKEWKLIDIMLHISNIIREGVAKGWVKKTLIYHDESTDISPRNYIGYHGEYLFPYHHKNYHQGSVVFIPQCPIELSNAAFSWESLSDDTTFAEQIRDYVFSNNLAIKPDLEKALNKYLGELGAIHRILEKAEDVMLERRAAGDNRAVVIGVLGPGGAGKSTFSDLLTLAAKAMGFSAGYVGCDAYLHAGGKFRYDMIKLPEGEYRNTNIWGPGIYNDTELWRVLNHLKYGGKVYKGADQYAGNEADLVGPNLDVLISDGVYMGLDKELSDTMDILVSIYVDTTEATRLERKIGRDMDAGEGANVHKGIEIILDFSEKQHHETKDGLKVLMEERADFVWLDSSRRLYTRRSSSPLGALIRIFSSNIRTGKHSYTWGRLAKESNILKLLGLTYKDLPAEDITDVNQEHPENEPVGELWLASDDQTYPSKVIDSDLNLIQLLEQQGERILGLEHIRRYGNSMATIMKLIDAGQSLSVQVHPAMGHPTRPAKPEMWMTSLGGARLYLGFSKDINQKILEEAYQDGSLESLLYQLNAKEGELIIVSGALIHAIRAGTTIWEWSHAPTGEEIKKGDLKRATVAPWDRTDGKSPRPNKEDLPGTLEVLNDALIRANIPAYNKLDLTKTYSQRTNLYRDNQGNRVDNLFTTSEVIVDETTLNTQTYQQTNNHGYPIFILEGSVQINASNYSPETLSTNDCAIIPAYLKEFTLTNTSNQPTKIIRWYAPISSSAIENKVDVRRENIDLMRKVLSSELYEGYNVIIISSSTDDEALYQQKLFEKVFGDKALILSVVDDTNRGNHIGTLYTWLEAEKMALAKGVDLRKLANNDKLKVMMLHNGGKGERFSPISQSLGNSRAKQKLVGTVEIANGENIDLELLLAVALQTSAFAKTNDQKRMEVVWTGQLIFGTNSFTRLERSNSLFDQIVVGMDPKSVSTGELMDLGIIRISPAGQPVKFYPSKTFLKKQADGKTLAVDAENRLIKDTDALDALAQSEDRFGYSLGTFSISYEMLFALLDYWNQDLKKIYQGKKDEVAKRDLDPDFVPCLVELIQENVDFSKLNIPVGLKNLPVEIRNNVLGQMISDLESKYPQIKNIRNYQEMAGLIILNIDKWNDITSLVGSADVGIDSHWLRYRRAIDAANEKLVMLYDLLGNTIKIDDKGDIEKGVLTDEDIILAKDSRRIRGITDEKFAQFAVEGMKIVLTKEQVINGTEVEGVYVKDSIVFNSDLKRGSKIINSVVNNSTGRFDVMYSYVESSLVGELLAVNSFIHKAVDISLTAGVKKGEKWAGEVIADVFRKDINDPRFQQGQSRVRAPIFYDPKGDTTPGMSDKIKFGDNAYSLGQIRDIRCNGTENDIVESMIRGQILKVTSSSLINVAIDLAQNQPLRKYSLNLSKSNIDELRYYLVRHFYSRLIFVGPRKISIEADFASDPQLGVVLKDVRDILTNKDNQFKDQEVLYARAYHISQMLSRIHKILNNEFSIEVNDNPGIKAFSGAKIDKAESNNEKVMEMLRSLKDLEEGRVYIGIDVGGSDVKLVAVKREFGEIKTLYQGKLGSAENWKPDAFTRADEYINIMISAVNKILNAISEEDKEKLIGIGMSWPDMIINDLIVGGDTGKTAGLVKQKTSGKEWNREELGQDEYWAEFEKLSNLIYKLEEKFEVPVAIANDGNITAFWAAVELAEANILGIAVGTAPGAGYVGSDGRLTPMFLRASNVVLTDDRRKETANDNTGIPGSAQKYLAQKGSFRLAAEKQIELLAEANDEKLEELQLKAREGDTNKENVIAIFQDMGRHFALFLNEIFNDFGEIFPKTLLLTGRITKQVVAGQAVESGKAFHDGIIEGIKTLPNLQNLKIIYPDDVVRDEKLREFSQAYGTIYLVNQKIKNNGSSPVNTGSSKMIREFIGTGRVDESKVPGTINKEELPDGMSWLEDDLEGTIFEGTIYRPLATQELRRVTNRVIIAGSYEGLGDNVINEPLLIRSAMENFPQAQVYAFSFHPYLYQNGFDSIKIFGLAKKYGQHMDSQIVNLQVKQGLDEIQAEEAIGLDYHTVVIYRGEIIDLSEAADHLSGDFTGVELGGTIVSPINSFRKNTFQEEGTIIEQLMDSNSVYEKAVIKIFGIGLDVAADRSLVYLPEAGAQRLNQLLKEIKGYERGKKLAVVVSEGRSQGRWLNGELNKTILGLIARNYRIVFDLGHESEIRAELSNVVMKLKQEYPENIVDLSLNMPEMTALLSLADLVIAVETGLMHLAVALEKKTVGLIPKGSRLIDWKPIYADNFISIVRDNFSAIKAEDVLAAVKKSESSSPVELNILHVTSELLPFVQVGGLANISEELPHSLSDLGCGISVVSILYDSIDRNRFHIRETGRKLTIAFGGRKEIASVWHTRSEGTDVYFLEHPIYSKKPYLDADISEYGLIKSQVAARYGRDIPEQEQQNVMERISFEQALFLSKGALELVLEFRLNFNVIHIHDWQAALVAPLIKEHVDYKSEVLLRNVPVIYSIHNLAYQGIFDKAFLGLTGLDWNLFNVEGLEFYGKINLMKAGINYSDLLSTVSKTYAGEILTPAFGEGLDGVLNRRKNDIYGILNGADYGIWRIIENDSDYTLENVINAKRYYKTILQNECGLIENSNAPVVGVISRIVEQKGLNLILEKLKEIIDLGAQFVLIGSGTGVLVDAFRELGNSSEYKGRISINFGMGSSLSVRRGDKLIKTLDKLLLAGADLYLMPSRHEPCGLPQIYSLKFGTIPIVRAVGGLNDTVDEFDLMTKSG